MNKKSPLPKKPQKRRKNISARNRKLKQPPNPRRPVRKKAKKRHSGTIIFSVIFIAVLSYMFRAVFALINKTEIPTLTVSYGSVDVAQTIDAVIIRDEQVYKSPKAGVLNFFYNNLDRIKKNKVVCSIADGEMLSQITSDITQKNERILEMQNMRKDITIFSGDVEMRNKIIKTAVENNIPKFINYNVKSLFDFAENLQTNMELRNQMLLTEDRGSVKELISQKEQLETTLKANVSNVTIQESGILYYIVDGLEEVLTIDKLDNITPEHVRMSVDYSQLKRPYEIAENDPMFKIIRSNHWYIATWVPSSWIINLKEKSFKTIYVKKDSDFVPLEVQISLIKNSEPESYVLFKVTKYMNDYLDSRNVKIKLSDTAQNGYKIPSTAIADKTFLKIPNKYVSEDDMTVIKKVNDNYEKIAIKPIDSVPSDEIYTYVPLDFSSLKLGDLLVLNQADENPYGISEVENVKGVYKINYGYAEFCKIIINEDSPVINGYCILDSAQNKRIKLSDQIIVDAKNIVEGQSLF